MRINKKALFIAVMSVTLAAAAFIIFLNSIYRLPILMYHSIDYTQDKKNKMVVSPEVFEAQMKFLRDRHYNVIPLEKAVGYISQKKRPPAKTLAITIDDGYEDNFKYAYPIFKKYNIPATIFVITGLVGKEGFMDWGQIKELDGSGLVDIESHTKSHKMLTYLDDAAVEEELFDAKRTLEKILGKEVRFLCYPMGRYDERVKAAAKRLGYKAAFATKATRLRPNYDVFEIKRVRISPTAGSLFVFWIKTSGYHTFFRTLPGKHEDLTRVIWKKKS